MRVFLAALLAFTLAPSVVHAADATAGSGGRSDRAPADRKVGSGASARPVTAEEVAALRREVEALRARAQELRAAVDDLRTQVAQLHSQLAREPLRAGQSPPGTHPPPPGAPPTDAKLKDLVRQMIQPRASVEEIDRAAREMTAYVGENKDLRKQASDAFTLALALAYGSPHAQQVMRRLQGQWRP